jgi:hypothetical protein
MRVEIGRLFGTGLGQDQDYLGESPEWLFRYLLLLKRATVGVRAPYATRLNQVWMNTTFISQGHQSSGLAVET